MKIGSHVSNNGLKMLVGSVEEALSYGENCFMVYLGAPQTTYRKDVEQLNYQKALVIAKQNGINPEDIIVHAPYIVNLGQKDDEKFNFAISFLAKELAMVGKVGLKYMVLHPGAHVGNGENFALDRIADGINEILRLTSNDNTVIAIETMAGKGTECGKTFEEIKRIIDLVHDKTRIGVCLDTCHIFDAGYDIVNSYEDVINEFDAVIGLEYLKVIHLNDSKNQFGSHKDRHENIGFGNIGFNALLKVLNDKRFEQIPKILETPYVSVSKLESYPPYKEEIEMLKKQTFNENLKEEVIKNHMD